MGVAYSDTHRQMWKCEALSGHSISQDTSKENSAYFSLQFVPSISEDKSQPQTLHLPLTIRISLSELIF